MEDQLRKTNDDDDDDDEEEEDYEQSFAATQVLTKKCVID